MNIITAYREWFKNRMHQFRENEAGAAFIEFAVCLPIIVMLFFGGVEVSRYLLIVKKLQSVVSAEANIITSTNPATTTMTKANMNAIANDNFQNMMQPYDATKGVIIITDIYYPKTDPSDPSAKHTPTVQWRYCGGGPYLGAATGSYPATGSKFGTVGKSADLSSLIVTSMAGAGVQPFTMSEGDEIVVAEVVYNFDPIIANGITNGFIKKRTLYFVSLSVPRFSDLTTMVGSSIKGNCS